MVYILSSSTWILFFSFFHPVIPDGLLNSASLLFAAIPFKQVEQPYK